MITAGLNTIHRRRLRLPGHASASRQPDLDAHSLRAGFLTSAARRGASVFKMRDVSRHKSMDGRAAGLRARRRLVPGSRGNRTAVTYCAAAACLAPISTHRR